MAEASIPVDLFNPGQVFACLGLVEASEAILGSGKGRFFWDADKTWFSLNADGEPDPLDAVFAFLKASEVATVAPVHSGLDTTKWRVPTEVAEPANAFPCPLPNSPATLPAVLTTDVTVLRLDHWADGTQRDKVKFWAGSNGYPGAALLRDAVSLLQGSPETGITDPFAWSAVQSSSFRFDWRRDYIPIDAGFSPNAHGTVVMVGFPLVEILAAIGLTHARPLQPEPSDKLLYHYGVLGGNEALPASLLRAGLTGVQSPVPGAPFRRFAMTLGWPGQEGQARCIVDVQELSPELEA